ncbi:MAG TPA: 5-formyltetrahydrofolate cyclo-ligase [Caulobacteraceae bacterium]|jgi:5,10-methenyltetrahydrofolate synthetase
MSARQTERARLIAAREAMPAHARAEASAAILATLRDWLPPDPAAVVAGYWPMRGEFDPLPWLRNLPAAALPVVTAPHTPLAFRPWREGAPMETALFRTTHPSQGEFVRPDVLLVPMVGFDAAGHRLGYGGGYYDRTIAALRPGVRAIGVGFELGRLASLEPQPHDARLDAIVTEAGVFEGS